MSKAEKRALEKYPIEMYEEVGWRCVDKNKHIRRYFIEGYHQAEKDLELNVEDIKIILDAENDILHECNDSSKLVIETYPKGEDYYGEILKRFKELKK